jgi:hypothetical protein
LHFDATATIKKGGTLAFAGAGQHDGFLSGANPRDTTRGLTVQFLPQFRRGLIIGVWVMVSICKGSLNQVPAFLSVILEINLIYGKD